MPTSRGVSKGDVINVMYADRDGKVSSENFKVSDVISTSMQDYVIYLESREPLDSGEISIRAITIRQATPAALRF